MACQHYIKKSYNRRRPYNNKSTENGILGKHQISAKRDDVVERTIRMVSFCQILVAKIEKISDLFSDKQLSQFDSKIISLKP